MPGHATTQARTSWECEVLAPDRYAWIPMHSLALASASSSAGAGSSKRQLEESAGGTRTSIAEPCSPRTWGGCSALQQSPWMPTAQGSSDGAQTPRGPQKRDVATSPKLLYIKSTRKERASLRAWVLKGDSRNF